MNVNVNEHDDDDNDDNNNKRQNNLVKGEIDFRFYSPGGSNNL